MKLYVYDHCPYCVRARMIFGLKKIPIELNILLNDDEATPISLIGQKMVPILEKADGRFMPESLDIVQYVDQHFGQPILVGQEQESLTQLTKQLDSEVYRKLVSPRVIQLKVAEFATAAAVDYFVHKKQPSLGDFADCLSQTPLYISQLQPLLIQLDNYLQQANLASSPYSINDILLFPLLRNLTCVNALILPAAIHHYIDRLADASQIPLYTDQAC